MAIRCAGFPSSITSCVDEDFPVEFPLNAWTDRQLRMDYHLKPMGKTCTTTGKPFVPGSLCHSVLVERNGLLVRLDYSDEGWQGPPEGHVGYWTIQVPEAPNPETLRLDPEVAMRYFEQLSEEANPEQQINRYALALLLLQKRKLKLENVRFDDSDEVLELTGLRGEGNFEVPNFRLDDARIQQLQTELKAHLAMEWQA